MKIYKVNINGDFKVKREININDYILWDCTGSTGITLKHKKNGKTIFLATKVLGRKEFSHRVHSHLAS